MNADDRSRFEQALRGLTPQAADLDRDRLMFAAGAVSTRRARRVWQGLGTTLGLVVAGLVLTLVLRPAQVITATVTQERLVYVPVPSETVAVQGGVFQPPALTPSPMRSSEDDARLQQVRSVVLRWGVDALPNPERSRGATQPDPPPTSTSGVRQLLGNEGL